ncbi:MAG: vWA domain-containing protein [Anaerolineae bacterium]
MNKPLNHPLDKPLHYPLNHHSPIRSFCLAVRGSAGIGLLVLSLAACAQSRGGASESPGSSGHDSAARSESVPGSDAKRSLDRSAPAPAAMSAAGDTDAEGGAAPDAAYSDIAPSEPPVPAPAQSEGQLAAGILTAGSFSDVLNFAAYRAFAEKFLATGAAAAGNPAVAASTSGEPVADSQEPLLGYPQPDFAVGPPLRIRVVDTGGLGVADARVVIKAKGDGEALVETVTRASGEVVLLTGLESDAAEQFFDVTVQPPRGGAAVKGVAMPGDAVNRIALPDVEGVLPKQLDLAFVIDVTGSMGDELEYLKIEVGGIVDVLSEAFPNVDQRYALIVYRDEGDEYVTREFDFTGDLAEFSHALSAQSADGGGDYPEAMQDALADAAELDWRDEGTARILFLLADAPPHVEDAGESMDQVRALRSAGVAIYPVAASGVAEAAEIIMRTAALLSASQYVFLTDDSGVGNQHAEPHIPCYDVEHLDATLIRMIATELTGHYIPAKPDTVLRRVGKGVDGVCRADAAESGPGPMGTPEQ